MSSLECVANLFPSFTEKKLKLQTTRKLHLLLSSDENARVNIDTSKTENSGCKKPVGIHLDCKLRLSKNVPKQGQTLRP